MHADVGPVVVDERTDRLLLEVDPHDLGDDDDVLSGVHALFDRGLGLPDNAIEEWDTEGAGSPPGGHTESIDATGCEPGCEVRVPGAEHMDADVLNHTRCGAARGAAGDVERQ